MDTDNIFKGIIAQTGVGQQIDIVLSKDSDFGNRVEFENKLKSKLLFWTSFDRRYK